MKEILKYLALITIVAGSSFIGGYTIGDARREQEKNEEIQCILSPNRNFGKYELSEMALNDAYIRASYDKNKPKSVEDTIKEIDTDSNLKVSWLEHYSWKKAQ